MWGLCSTQYYLLGIKVVTIEDGEGKREGMRTRETKEMKDKIAVH